MFGTIPAPALSPVLPPGRGAGGGRISQTALRSRGGGSAKRTLDGEDGRVQSAGRARILFPLLLVRHVTATRPPGPVKGDP